MENIKAIGFDLFNTLITVEPQTLSEATERLIQSLRQSGFLIEEESFLKRYREKAVKFIDRARKDGRETHNSLWISAALEDGGDTVSPRDSRVGEAVEHYFSAFYDHCTLIPETMDMLNILRKKYSIGLLSNFTHGPAAREILKITKLESCFKTILISGELGYRKPHPMVFASLVERLGEDKGQTAYVGDDPDPDIHGAQKAGLQPIWTTYVKDRGGPLLRGVIQSDVKKPEFSVPRISSWHELLILLNEN